EARVRGPAPRHVVGGSLGGSRSLNPKTRAPGKADQSVFHGEPVLGGAGEPAARLGDSIGVPDFLRAGPFLDSRPEGGGQWRRAAEDALESASRGPPRRLEGESPDGRDGGKKRDPATVDHAAELDQQIRAKGREHVEILAEQPRKEAVADQAMAEVCGQEAERAPELLDAQRVLERRPASSQRA